MNRCRISASVSLVSLVLLGVTALLYAQDSAPPAPDGVPLGDGSPATARVTDDNPSAFEIGRNDKVRCGVERSEIRLGLRNFRGDDPRDLIRPIYEPEFQKLAGSGWADDARMLLVTMGDVARAYPVGVLTRHEVANDRIGDRAFMVVFCPLCGTGSCFNRTVGLVERKFGVSGYLYKSDVILWDHYSESFWSQVDGAAVAGPATGTKLEWLPVQNTTAAAIRAAHPDAMVLKGPYPARAYAVDPYRQRGYYEEDAPGKHVDPESVDRRMHQKTVCSGVMVDGVAYCVPHPEAAKLAGPTEVTVNEQMLTIRYDKSADVVTITKGEEPLVVLRAFWFAWFIFHPDTEVFEAPGGADDDGEAEPGEGDGDEADGEDF